ncbi:MAG: TatD family hydrolase [Nanoarchaeota archaeon]|nr:TatD family hydrolase [Nanoarchaeota archaeon]MBU1703871.1 TatD family hydrolase [Nanoarchaeota archaeon]
MYIDIHCHLDHPEFKDRLEKVIQDAKKAGVKLILTNGINPETNRITLELAKKYDIVKPALGIYPINQLKKEIEEGNYPLKPNVFDVDEEIKYIEKNKDKILAIGECGLDGLDAGSMEDQKKVFQKLINLAEKIKRPLIVHSRKAEADVIEVLEHSKAKVLLHCFSGKKSLIKKAAELGYSFSIPTNVVRAQNFQDLIKMVDINQLFAETDSPYLSPFKDKRNEPAFIVESYKKIAEIKGMTLEDTKNNIWMNYQKLFQ